MNHNPHHFLTIQSYFPLVHVFSEILAKSYGHNFGHLDKPIPDTRLGRSRGGNQTNSLHHMLIVYALDMRCRLSNDWLNQPSDLRQQAYLLSSMNSKEPIVIFGRYLPKLYY